MADGGYITLSHAFFDSWVWKLKSDQRDLFIYLIYRARWKKDPSKVVLPEGYVMVERGQLWTTERKLSAGVGVGRQVVRTGLNLFERERCNFNPQANPLRSGHNCCEL